jgi:hypothetical protein
MQIKKIFLASSAELKEDRRAFALMLAQLNPKWRVRDYSFDPVVWEDFVDAMAPEGLQSKYDEAVADCDIFVMMFLRAPRTASIARSNCAASACTKATGMPTPARVAP